MTESTEMANSRSAERFAGQIEAARRGDRGSLEFVLSHESSHLTRTAKSALARGRGGLAGASDLVQETFSIAIRHIAGFRGTTRAEWRAWLVRIQSRVLAAWRRGAWGRRACTNVPELSGSAGPESPTGPIVDPNTPPVEAAIRSEWQERLDGAVRELPARDREILCLHHVQGLSLPACAETLEISVDAAEKRWTRTIIRLRNILGSDDSP